MRVVRVHVPSPPFFFEEKFEFDSDIECETFIDKAKELGVLIISDYEISPMSAKAALQVCEAIMKLENVDG